MCLSTELNTVQYSVQCTVYTVQCTVYTVDRGYMECCIAQANNTIQNITQYNVNNINWFHDVHWKYIVSCLL